MTESNSIETRAENIGFDDPDELTVPQALELLKAGYAELTPD